MPSLLYHCFLFFQAGRIGKNGYLLVVNSLWQATYEIVALGLISNRADAIILDCYIAIVLNDFLPMQQAEPFKPFVEELGAKVPSIVSIYDCRGELGLYLAHILLCTRLLEFKFGQVSQ